METTVQIAVRNNCKKIIDLLLSHDANVNEKDYNAKTALDIAVFYIRKKNSWASSFTWSKYQ